MMIWGTPDICPKFPCLQEIRLRRSKSLSDKRINWSGCQELYHFATALCWIIANWQLIFTVSINSAVCYWWSLLVNDNSSNSLMKDECNNFCCLLLVHVTSHSWSMSGGSQEGGSSLLTWWAYTHLSTKSRICFAWQRDLKCFMVGWLEQRQEGSYQSPSSRAATQAMGVGEAKDRAKVARQLQLDI